MVQALGLLEKIDACSGKRLIFFKFAKGGKIAVECGSNSIVSHKKFSHLLAKNNKTLDVRKTRKYDEGKTFFRETNVFLFFYKK